MIDLPKTFPNAFVMTNPGDFAWPQFRPFVKILETITIFFTVPDFLAASISLMVPRLSCVCVCVCVKERES